MHFLSAFILLPLGTALAANCKARSVSTIASYYGGNLAGGNCMFSSYTLPSGVYGTALSGQNWNSSGVCGTCVDVTGPLGNIKAMVVDKCPGCETNQLDLFPDAFAAIGNPNDGIINISWNLVPCGITGPLKIRNKEGTSKYWFSMQVFNSNRQVTALQVSADGGSTWQPTVRRDYNFFEKSDGSGFGVDTTTVRVTCSNGAQITVSNVGTSAGATYAATSNC